MRRIVRVGVLGVSLVVAGVMQAQAVERQAAPPLEGTHWRLRWVDGVKVTGTSVHEPYIEFDSAQHRVTGSGGCNRLMGGYVLEGDHLRLTGTAMTRMACLNAGDTEDRFVKALEETREWKVWGETLELLDGSGNVVARFDAGRAD